MPTVSRALIALALVAAPATLSAQAADPAHAPVQALDAGLLQIMKAGKAAGQRGRVATITPVVERSFDVPLMTRLAIGPSWTTIAPADQTALVAAFRRLTAAQYAANFDGWSGEAFSIDPKVENRGGDKLVRTTLTAPHGGPTAISYRLRDSGSGWRIIDVFYKNAISQLTTRRSDFTAVLQSGGAKALVQHLDKLAAKGGLSPLAWALFVAAPPPAAALVPPQVQTAPVPAPTAPAGRDIAPADIAKLPPPARALDRAPPAALVAPHRHHAPGDPLEGLNRRFFKLNTALDKAIFRPAALGYKHAVPRFARTGLRNFFSNLTEPIVFLNDLLQLKPGRAAKTLVRFAVNSTVGLAGLADPAKLKPLSIPHHDNGFGSTLGRYGVGPGPYIYLPFAGPTTLRDLLGGQADRLVLPFTVQKPPFDRYEYQVPKAVLTGLDARAESDDELKALFSGAIDPYATLRSVFLQNRAGEIAALRGRPRLDAPTGPNDVMEDPLRDPATAPAPPSGAPELRDPLADPAAPPAAKPAPATPSSAAPELSDPLADPAAPPPPKSDKPAISAPAAPAAPGNSAS